MLGYDAETGRIKHYRVDKMSRISALDRLCDGKEEFKKIDMTQYSKKVFSMFTGEEPTVKLRFTNHLVGSVIDRFGRDTITVPDGDDHLR